MFAIPLNAPLHETLASHVFGRFMIRNVQYAGMADVAARPAAPSPTVAAMEAPGCDDEIVDLAQRVREMGEWAAAGG